MYICVYMMLSLFLGLTSCVWYDWVSHLSPKKPNLLAYNTEMRSRSLGHILTQDFICKLRSLGNQQRAFLLESSKYLTHILICFCFIL
jgi:hypothetical protein